MNIMVINSAKEWGGTEKWALCAADGLAQLGHKVYFGCRGSMFQNRSIQNNFEFVTFPFANNADIFTIFQIRSFLKKKSIDVVMPSKQREYFLAGIAAKMSTDIKVAGVYGIDRPIHNLRNRIVFCNLFDIVFVNARKIVEVLSKDKSFDVSKCRLVYVGVQPVVCNDSTRLRVRESLGLTQNQICIMGIGRVAPQKGFDYGIKALSVLVKKHPDVKLVIVGSGNIEVYKKMAEDYGVYDKVIFTGFREDIHDLVQAMDIYWLPSRSEGIPNTMMEAMAAKKPVVAFDIAGVAELIKNEENGIVIPFEDVEMLSSMTADLIENPQKRKIIGENGYQTVVNDYSMEKMCQTMEKYLLELVEKRDLNRTIP